MTARLATLLATSLALVPSIAAAHPGHGHTEPDTWRHYLTEPIHIAALAGVATLAIGIGSAWRRARRRRSGTS